MTPTRLLAAGGSLALLALLALAPGAALAGWRAAFVVAGSVPLGATFLLLVARVTGADWTAALKPLTAPLPWLIPAAIPLAVQQGWFVAPGDHATWLWWPFFLGRTVMALAIWWLISAEVAWSRLSPLGAGLGLVFHGVAVTILGTDWLLGATPGQPQSAVGFVLVTIEVAAAAGAACLLGLGTARQRDDLFRLALAGALGVAYLLLVDYLIVWYGDLPQHAGWYVVRRDWPWAAAPMLALLLGLGGTIGGIAVPHRIDRRIGAGALLAALVIATGWEAAGGAGWIGLFAAIAAILPVVVLAPQDARA